MKNGGNKFCLECKNGRAFGETKLNIKRINQTATLTLSSLLVQIFDSIQAICFQQEQEQYYPLDLLKQNGLPPKCRD